VKILEEILKAHAVTVRNGPFLCIWRPWVSFDVLKLLAVERLNIARETEVWVEANRAAQGEP